MAAVKGKIAALVIFVLLMILAAFVLTPLALAPFGVFAGLARGMRHAVTSGWHFGPWFPFAPGWSFSLLFFVIWIAVIVWVYRDAEERKMSGVLWALLVFIGNLIGLLIYLIVRQDHPLPVRAKTSPPVPAGSPPSPPAPASPVKTPLVCPSCQKPLEKDFAFCPHCGTTLRRVCRNCGKPVQEGWKICPHCGAQLEKQE